MPYEVRVDQLSVLKAIATHEDDDGKVTGYDHESVIHPLGAVLDDSEVSPVVQKLYEEEDEHTRSVLKKVSGKKSSSSGGDGKSDEPLPDYDNLTADQVVEQLKGADDATVAAVKEYESNNKRRVTVLSYGDE